SYNADDSCTFPQRPHAKTCTLFRDRDKPLKSERPPQVLRRQPTPTAVWVLAAILAIAVLLALL
ncbi:MAG: zinc ribbon domain-containing protein, partial [Cyanobacteria bacterium J06641_5]